MIRELDVTDITPLSGLAQHTYREAFGEAMSPDDLAFVLNEKLAERPLRVEMLRDTFLVSGDFRGFVQFGEADYPEVSSQPGDGAVKRIYVLAKHQGKGFGGELLSAALEQMKERPRVYLDVWDKNAAAIRFYERYGFRVVGEKRFMMASGPSPDPDLIMVRERSTTTT